MASVYILAEELDLIFAAFFLYAEAHNGVYKNITALIKYKSGDYVLYSEGARRVLLQHICPYVSASSLRHRRKLI